MKIEISLKRFLKPRKNKKIVVLALVFFSVAGVYGATRAIIINFGRIETIHVGSSKTTNEVQRQLLTKENPKELEATSHEESKKSVSCNFTYLKPGETAPKLDGAELSLTSRNPVIRIYNKVAKLSQLQRELNGLPPLPQIQARPLSVQLQCPPNMTEYALKSIEEDLDEQLARLEKLLADNPSKKELLPARL